MSKEFDCEFISVRLVLEAEFIAQGSREKRRGHGKK